MDDQEDVSGLWNSPRLPCNLPCPKCGSTDVHRHYRFAGEGWSGNWNRSPMRYADVKEYVDNSLIGMVARKECIEHTCRVCSYLWLTDPLKAPG